MRERASFMAALHAAHGSWALRACRGDATAAATLLAALPSPPPPAVTVRAHKLRRGGAGSPAPCVLRSTPCELQRLDAATGRVLWRVPWRRVASLQPLPDGPAAGGGAARGCVALRLRGAGPASPPKVFALPAGTADVAALLGVPLAALGDAPVVLPAAAMHAAALAAGASCAGGAASGGDADVADGGADWAAMRLRLNEPEAEVGDDVASRRPAQPRRLSLAAGMLTERRAGDYTCAAQWPLRGLVACVRHVSDPQRLTLLFSDCFSHDFSGAAEPLTFATPQRDALVAALLDAAETAAGAPPPPLLAASPRRGEAISGGGDAGGEAALLLRLAAAARAAAAAVADDAEATAGGGVASALALLSPGGAEKAAASAAAAALAPGAGAIALRCGATPALQAAADALRARAAEVCFGARGVSPAAAVPDVCVHALLALLPDDVALRALRCLAASREGAAALANAAAGLTRVTALIISSDDVAAVGAAALLAALASRNDAAGTAARAAALPSVSAAVATLLAPLAVSPPASAPLAAALVAAFAAAAAAGDASSACALAALASLGRPLFALLSHPGGATRDRVRALMAAVAAAAVAHPARAAPLRAAALAEGALLQQLHGAASSAPGARRDACRDLVALWASAHAPAMALLARALPPALLDALTPDHAEGPEALTPPPYVNPFDTNPFDEPPPVQAEPVAQQQPPALNWARFWAAFDGDCAHPALLWNDAARAELRDALAAEERSLRRAQAAAAAAADAAAAETEASTRNNDSDVANNADFSQLAISSGSGGEPAPHRLSWNHGEFRVRYAAGRELRCGGVWVRLLAEAHEASLEAPGIADTPSLRDPPALLRALFDAFAAAGDAEALGWNGLMMSSADDCDDYDAGDDAAAAAALAGGRPRDARAVRELCARGMAAAASIGGGSGVSGFGGGCGAFLRCLDASPAAGLRAALLRAVAALAAGGAANGDAARLVAAGAVPILLDVVAAAHSAREAGEAPPPQHGSYALAGRAIAAGAHSDAMQAGPPPREWFFAPTAAAAEGDTSADGDDVITAGDPARQGPYDKAGLRAAFADGTLTSAHYVWARGMGAPVRFAASREMRWSVACEPPPLPGAGCFAPLSPAGAAGVAFDALDALLAASPAADSAGDALWPRPRARAALSCPTALATLAASLLHGRAEGTASLALPRRAARLLRSALADAPPATAGRLYATGAFVAAMAHDGAEWGDIAALLAATHTRQLFPGVALDAAAPLPARSALGALLPESLLTLLEADGSGGAFAAAFVADSYTPALVWTAAMRRGRLGGAAREHLGSWPARCAQRWGADYDAGPPPRCVYPELSRELFCGGLHLRAFCDERRFPPPHAAPLPPGCHVALLQAMLGEWRAEACRTPPRLSLRAARQALELPVDDVAVDEASLRRAYRQLARIHHPDKRPADGGARFAEVQAAYDRLLLAADASAEDEGPRAWRVALLLKAQCILFRRAPDVFAPFKYAAFPPLLDLLRENGDAALAAAAAELTWRILARSPLNAEELARAGGAPIFAALLCRCLAAAQSAPDAGSIGNDACPDGDDQVGPPAPLRLAAFALRTLGGLAAFPRLHAALAPLLPRLAPDIVAAASLPCDGAACSGAFDAAHAALGAGAALAAAPAARTALLRAGLAWAALRRCLEWNDAASEPPASAGDDALAGADGAPPPPPRRGAAALRNGGALLGARCAARLAGVGGGNAGSGLMFPPPHPAAAAACAALLTPPLAALLAEAGPAPLLAALAGETRTPRLIWGRTQRGELAERLDALSAQSGAAFAAFAGDDGTFSPDPLAAAAADAPLEAASRFRFASLAPELVVGGMYVNVFNAQRGAMAAQGPEAAAFAAALRDFLARGRWRPEWRDDDVAHDAADVALARSGDDLVAALRAAAALAAAEAALSAVFATPAALGALAAALPALGGAPAPGVPAGARADAACAAADALRGVAASGGSSREAFAAHASALPRLFACIDAPPDSAARAAALGALAAAAPAGGTAWAAAHTGGALYLLALALPPPPKAAMRKTASKGLFDDDDQSEDAAASTNPFGAESTTPALDANVSEGDRLAAAALLGRLVASPAHGGRVAALLRHLLPASLVAALAASGGNAAAALAALTARAESPERLWSPACAAAVAAELAPRLMSLRAAAAAASAPLPDEPLPPLPLPDAPFTPPQLSGEPVVGGVYLRHYLRDTSFPLSDPAGFTAAALEAFLAGGADAKHAAPAAAGAIAAGGAAAAGAAAALGFVPRLLPVLSEADWEAQDLTHEHAASSSPEAASGLAAACAAAAAASAAEAASAAAAGVGGRAGGALRLLHALAGAPGGAEALANAASAAAPALLAAASGLGATAASSARSAVALETLKRALQPGVRSRDALVAACLASGFVGFLLAFLDWRSGDPSESSGTHALSASALDEAARPAELARVLAVDVLTAMGAPGAHAAAAAAALEGSETWAALAGRRHDLFLPAGAAGARAGVAGLLLAPPAARVLALPRPPGPGGE
jgi:DnaJ family protein C protein 13